MYGCNSLTYLPFQYVIDLTLVKLRDCQPVTDKTTTLKEASDCQPVTDKTTTLKEASDCQPITTYICGKNNITSYPKTVTLKDVDHYHVTATVTQDDMTIHVVDSKTHQTYETERYKKTLYPILYKMIDNHLLDDIRSLTIGGQPLMIDLQYTGCWIRDPLTLVK